MNKIIIAGLLLTTSVGVQAQTLKDAKKKVENERYDLARKDFQALIQKDPASIDNAFFYGNFLVTVEENTAAIEQFKSAASKNAEDKLAMVSGAKATYFSGDSTAAGIKFREIIKATKSKNACVFLRIAETYATGPVKNLPLAEAYLKKVLVLEPTNIEAMQLLGDVILDQSTSRVSETVEQYNSVLRIEPTNVSASVKKARIYERVKNDEAALQGYEAAEKIDPTFGPAYRYHAELAMRKGDVEKSSMLWTKYLELNDAPEARYRYAASLYIGKKYPEAIVELKKVEKLGLADHYTKRMLFYSTFEINVADSLKYPEILATGDEYFSVVKPEKTIALDYDYYAKTLLKLGKVNEALEAYSKCAALDANMAADGLSAIATTSFKSKNYAGAINAYSKKLAAAPAKMKSADWFEYGKASYFVKDYLMADSCFTMVTQLSVDYAPGYLWKGRALSITDTDIKNRNWKAQPAYETYLAKLKDTDKQNANNKDYIIEASRYLGDYYVNSPAKDMAKAKVHWQQVLALDPNNQQAKIFLSSH